MTESGWLSCMAPQPCRWRQGSASARVRHSIVLCDASQEIVETVGRGWSLDHLFVEVRLYWQVASNLPKYKSQCKPYIGVLDEREVMFRITSTDAEHQQAPWFPERWPATKRSLDWGQQADIRKEGRGKKKRMANGTAPAPPQTHS